MPDPRTRKALFGGGVFGEGGPSDTGRPAVTITSTESSPTAASPIPVTVTFTDPVTGLPEAVTGFEVGDITVVGATLGDFTEASAGVYTVNATPAGNAPISIDVAAEVAEDAAGNLNTVADTFEIGIQVTLTYQPDETAGVDMYFERGAPDTVGNSNYLRMLLNNRVGAIKFPISLSAGFSVVSGTLSLWAQAELAGQDTITVSRILAAAGAWNEASTWNYMTPSTARWPGDTGSDGGADAGCNVAGTDYSATPLGTFVHGNNDAASTKYDVVLDVTELALMCANNYGLNMVSNQGSTEVRVKSANDATAGERPKLVLVVNYLP